MMRFPNQREMLRYTVVPWTICIVLVALWSDFEYFKEALLSV